MADNDRVTPVRVLALSGSLRVASSSTALLTAAVRLTIPGVEVSLYSNLEMIPPFNPDLDAELIEPVRRFRTTLDSSDAVVICSPEYAHGVSGVLKNALDWIVATGELIGKPIAVINASRRATHADAALRETLRTMSGRLIEQASIVIPLDGGGWNADAILADLRLATALSETVVTLARAAAAHRAQAPPPPISRPE